MEACSPGRLASTELRLIQNDEVGTDGARAKEDKATDRHSAIKGYLAGGDADNEGSGDSKKLQSALRALECVGY